MALQLEDYLRTRLPEQKSEIEQIGKTAGAVLERFHVAFDATQNSWPYRVDHGAAPKAAEPADYSFSTNSMVLFALKTLLGDYEPQVAGFAESQPLLNWTSGNVALLTPMLARSDRDLIVAGASTTVEPQVRERRWAELNAQLQPLVKATTQELAKRIDEQLASSSARLTYSRTFDQNDPFTLCWLLESVTPLHDAWIGILCARAKEAVEAPSKFRLGAKDNAASEHALPLLRGLQMYARLRRSSLCPKIELTNIKQWFESRLHEHLSYASIPDSSFDAPELIFALEGLLICEPQSLGIERLLQRVIEVVQEKQQHNPNLRPYRPILSDERGQALLPLTIEVFTSLLRIFERLASDNSRILKFAPVHSILQRYAEWLLGQRCHIQTPGGELSGWSSEHTNTRNCVHVWETSQVLLFLVHYRALLREQLQREILDVANFTIMRPQLQDYMPRTEADCVQAEPCQTIFLYRQIWKDFIAPRASNSFADAKSSMLLFGPPGTGKTTFAEYLAGMLGWQLITLSPSDFIERGDQGVEARAKAIFRALEELSEKVILFDEIDRLLVDRDSVEYSEQDDIFQFMTPSMLTKLRNLRRLARCIFIVATNYEDRIDPAAKRHGRIDDRIPVLPPDRRYREIRLSKELKDRNWNAAKDKYWNDALEQSALYTFAELNGAIRDAFDGHTSGTDAIKALTKYVSEHPPEIRLSTYTARLGLQIVEGEAVPHATGPSPSQPPNEEFRRVFEIARENPKTLGDSVATSMYKQAGGT